MLDLGAYDSSSEEETQAPPQAKEPTQEPPAKPAQIDQKDEDEKPATNTQDQKQPNNPQSEPLSGPALGPASGPAPPPLESVQSPNDQPLGGRSSPFSASRALIQDLTLPPVPNLDIPPSPPGSPNPAANAKFEHFLSLKKQGVHFNSKLASSSSLKNPSLLKKMMEHAGINEQSQYNTSLPAEIWDISSLPQWGFKEELLRTQQDARQRQEEKNSSGQRSAVEFVSGSGSESRKRPHP
ncbi:uncharacterized protein N7469_011160 [Penicillium citrinum]|uniref:HCNGP-like protein n=1 Tax=Penicillium citrinum TaxID=5077 RepID=A0A9W9TDG8_PENCI|nr:uncharacterized protein N7469_011160 [Penicillium citrinum]KAJ5217535.1 hypothetical protein N7469_011160 [Penicillium citrinum]